MTPALSETIDSKTTTSTILLLLPGAVILIIAIQAGMRLFQFPLCDFPIIGGLAYPIHGNDFLAKAAFILYQNTVGVAVIFLLCVLCWILQGYWTLIKRNRDGAIGVTAGSIFFIGSYTVVHLPLLTNIQGYVIEKIIFFGILFLVALSLVQSFVTFPWKEILIEAIFKVLSEAREIIRDTEERVETEIAKIDWMKAEDAAEVLRKSRDIKTSCREMVSEADTKERKAETGDDISELKRLLGTANDLLDRAEKKRESVEEVKESIRRALSSMVDRMHTEVTSLGYKMGCSFKLNHLPEHLKEVNIPGHGSTGIGDVPDTLRLMIEAEEMDAREFEDIFDTVERHLANVKKYIEDNVNALDYEGVKQMIENAEQSITNIPNDLISRKLKYLYINNPDGYQELKIAKDAIGRVRENVCKLQFDDASGDLETANKNINLINEQVNFIRTLITTVEKRWYERRITPPNPDLLMDLEDEFYREYGAKFTTHRNILKIEYEPIPEEEIIQREDESHPNEVRAILCLLGEKIRSEKKHIVSLSKDDLPRNAKGSVVLNEFGNFVLAVLGEDVRCDTKTDSIEIEFEEDLDPVESINKVIEAYNKEVLNYGRSDR